jgi:uncharacterized membrane protein YphA (DoxX/SURF4 family)
VWLLAAVSAAAVAVAWLGERLWRRVRPPVPRDLQLSAARLERLFALMPVILGTHAAAALLASGIRMQLFAPNLPLPRDFWGALVALAQIVVALSFVYGAFTRVFAWLLVALFPAALLLFPPLDVAEHLHLLGIALYLAILGRGPYSLDGVLGRPVRPLLGWVPYAVPLLRWCTGLGLVALAFGEKLWNPDLGLAFLQRYDFNFLRAWGVPDRAFVLLAGYVEATVGVLVEVHEGEGVAEIAERLQSLGIVRSSLQLRTLIALLGYDGLLLAGTYEFRPGSSALEVAQRLRHGRFATFVLTVIEGWSLAQIAQAVEDSGVASALDFELAAVAGPYRQEFEQEFARRGLHPPALEGDEESRAVRAAIFSLERMMTIRSRSVQRSRRPRT